MKMISVNSKKIYIAGSGGHAKMVINTLSELGYQIEALYDDDARKQGNTFCGVPVVGPIDSFYKLKSVNAIIAIGDNRIRNNIVAKSKDINWITAVHPEAYVHKSVRIGDGTVVFAGAVVQPDTIIGSHSIVNTGATIDHDCRVGDFVHIAPGSHLGGNVHVGAGTLIGISSAVLPNLSIGEWSVVGACAAVIHDLLSSVTAVGVPAQVIKQETQ